MNTTTRNAARQSGEFLRESATAYRNVAYTSGEYRPDVPFKGLQVGTAGDIVIEGLDGVQETLSDVQAGDHPFAGQAIIETGTTATGITALF